MVPSLVAGAACGLLWWGVAQVLGAERFGLVGTHGWAGVVASVCTGIVVAAMSIAFYRRSSLRNLLWYSPLSVYLAVAIYGLVLFAIRLMQNDFPPGQIRWAVAVEAVVGMWWGVTVLLPVAVLVHLLAYANHRLLRSVVGR